LAYECRLGEIIEVEETDGSYSHDNEGRKDENVGEPAVGEITENFLVIADSPD
jgi:hypothetical protein